MPFCTHCGHEVDENDRFCGNCGARQPNAGGGSAAMPSAPQTSDGIPDKTACVLCYIPFVGWIVSIVVLAAKRFRDQRVVRFHAFQGLYLFVAWLLVEQVISPVLFAFSPWMWGGGFFEDGAAFRFVGLATLLQLTLIGVGVFMMFRVSDDEMFRLPLLGDLAERSL
jgi:uncharacterized membrane protein